MSPSIVYKIVAVAEWAVAEAAGRYTGSSDDARDGFIHLSTAAQLAATAERHFRGRDGLLVVAVAAEPLGEALRFEPSRGGDLFPHLYGELPLSAVVFVRPITTAADGSHRLPPLES